MKFELQKGKIYLIKCLSPDNFVKIGWAIDAKSRLIDLQHGCPYKLELLREMTGYIWQERWLQEYFKYDRIHGEWFNFKSEMLTIEPPNLRPEIPPKEVPQKLPKEKPVSNLSKTLSNSWRVKNRGLIGGPASNSRTPSEADGRSLPTVLIC